LILGLRFATVLEQQARELIPVDQFDLVLTRQFERRSRERRRRYVDGAVGVVVGVRHPDEQLDVSRSDRATRRVLLALNGYGPALFVSRGDVDAEVASPSDYLDAAVVHIREQVGDRGLEPTRRQQQQALEFA
jgi:hypothetical protein